MSNENNGRSDDEWKKKFFKVCFNINNETFDNCLDDKNNHIPNSLFKYSKIKNVFSLLSDDLIVLSKIEDLNDPFECDIFYDLEVLLDNLNEHLINFADYSKFVDENTSKEDLGKISKVIKNLFKEPFEEVLLELEDNFKNELSIICLSEDYCINPMWAHYADNHKGVCIEYDLKNIPELIFKYLCFPIDYVEKSDNTLELLSFFDDNIKINPNWILKLALMKSHDWKYENEWRIIVSQRIADYFNEKNLKNFYFEEYYSDKHYIKFIKPKSIYLGLDIDLEDEKKLIDICKFRKISIYKMKKDKSKYNLKSEPILEF